MTKHRKPQTVYSACSYAVSKLSEDDIRDAIGKSVSMVRRASDPDDSAVEISFTDAVKLGAKLEECGFEDKFEPAFSASKDAILNTIIGHEVGDLLVRVADGAASFGALAAEIRDAMDEGGPGGRTVTAFERDRIEAALGPMFDAIGRIQLDLETMRNSPTNIHTIHNKKEAS